MASYGKQSDLKLNCFPLKYNLPQVEIEKLLWDLNHLVPVAPDVHSK